MSNLYRRNGNIFKANSSDSTDVDFAASYTVTAYAPGAQANGAQTGVSSITVHAGHGISTGDKFMVGLTDTNFFVAGTVTATSIPLDTGTVTVADNELIVNLGSGDTGSIQPVYDGSTISTYLDGNGQSANSNSRVTCDAQGGYGYWHDSAQVWELVRDGNGTPVETIPDTVKGVTGPASSTDNAIARFDGTSGRVVQDYTSGAPTVSDTGAVAIPLTLAVTGATTLTGAVEMDGALNHDGSTAGFFDTAPTTQPTALTTQLTSITHTSPSTPDYALQDLTSTTPFGFVTKDEGNTVLSVILNLQARVAELETKLQALGLLA